MAASWPNSAFPNLPFPLFIRFSSASQSPNGCEFALWVPPLAHIMVKQFVKTVCYRACKRKYVYFTFTSWSRTLDSLLVSFELVPPLRIFEPRRTKWSFVLYSAATTAAIRTVATFIVSQPGQDAKGSPKVVLQYSVWRRRQPYSRIAWDSRNAHNTYTMRCNNSGISECIYKRYARCTNTVVVTSHCSLTV